MISTRNAQNELNELKDSVIGIYKENNRFYLVTEYDDIVNAMNCIQITPFGAIQQIFGMPLREHLILFPNNQNMNEILDKPHEWGKFIESFL